MDKRDPHLINYNESVGWKDAFRLHPSPLTPGKSLRKVMTVKMDIPSSNSLNILGGTNGTWLLMQYPGAEVYYITSEGKVKIIGKDFSSIKTGRGKYIFSDGNEDIFLIDTDNDNVIDTGLNKNRDGINNVLNKTLITDYGEFAYVKNGILTIPDRNLSIKIKNNKAPIEFIGLDYYTTVEHVTWISIFTSYNFNNDFNGMADTLVYKNKLISKYVDILGINDKFYYTKFNQVYSTDDKSFIEILDIPDILSKTGERWDTMRINFEYTQVITSKKIDSGYVFNIYQH